MFFSFVRKENEAVAEAGAGAGSIYNITYSITKIKRFISHGKSG